MDEKSRGGILQIGWPVLSVGIELKGGNVKEEWVN